MRPANLLSWWQLFNCYAAIHPLTATSQWGKHLDRHGSWQGPPLGSVMPPGYLILRRRLGKQKYPSIPYWRCFWRVGYFIVQFKCHNIFIERRWWECKRFCLCHFLLMMMPCAETDKGQRILFILVMKSFYLWMNLCSFYFLKWGMSKVDADLQKCIVE